MSKTANFPPSESKKSEAELSDWSSEELARIRVVFRKLTALRVENPDDAEDLVQETFLTMTEKCSEIELQKGLLVWGMGILRKKVGNYYRRSQRYVSLDQEIPSRDIARLAQKLPSAESMVQHIELRSLVEAILEKFPSEERTVMHLLLAGYSTNEIAERLYPERYQNIVNRIHRGRKKLHKELARYGYIVSSYRKETRGRKPRMR